MARIIRQYDPNETLRRITIEIKEDINVLCGHGGRPDNRLPNGKSGWR